MLSFRFADEKDAAVIADLSREAFRFTFGPQNETADMDKFLREQFTREGLMQEVGDPKFLFLLAYANDVLAGYVKLIPGSAESLVQARHPIEIARFYAVPAMIGKGIGKAMMQQCIELAMERNHDVIWLGVWEKNIKAIGFYASFGFRQIGTHGFLVGNDLQTDLLLQLEL